jgi:8-oxoguanine deaminase
MSADVIAFDLDTVGLAGGADHDPLAALVFCAAERVAWSIVDGRVVIREGRLCTIDVPLILERQRALTRALFSGEA